ncbi:HIT family protein [Spongiibacter taiwanensis]|uniref:HIT family protein n=1 Tax=Spongiibacter taiwanensis TaxID=1748242 RepID=UPI002035B1EA|nr:HIT family protein [Spongiibacter taiwanensis]USA43261.1 HIT family protein [Spongiibacter taiwanensis]
MASIFSRIIAGELPGHFVWRDELCVAIMTIEPVRPGHVLLIPIEEVDHWDDLPESLATHLQGVARKLAKALKTVYQCQRVTLSIVGLEVPHTHLHLWPINQMGDVHLSQASIADQGALASEAEKIRQALAG